MLVSINFVKWYNIFFMWWSGLNAVNNYIGLAGERPYLNLFCLIVQLVCFECFAYHYVKAKKALGEKL